MRGLVQQLIRCGLDIVFGKAEPFEYRHPTTSRCPNCLREL